MGCGRTVQLGIQALWIALAATGGGAWILSTEVWAEELVVGESSDAPHPPDTSLSPDMNSKRKSESTVGVSPRGGDIQVGNLLLHSPPLWLTTAQVRECARKIERAMEWDLRTLQVSFYSDEKAFAQAHGLNASVVATSVKSRSQVLLGPRVTQTNFSGVFGHELVHMTLAQKYALAIPDWIEEGLANYLSHHDPVDYAALQQKLAAPTLKTFSIRELTHPNLGRFQSRFHYQASTAAAEMLNSRCRGIEGLLGLSVGSKMESYLSTFCEIPHLDEAFGKWVNQRADATRVRPGASSVPSPAAPRSSSNSLGGAD